MWQAQGTKVCVAGVVEGHGRPGRHCPPPTHPPTHPSPLSVPVLSAHCLVPFLNQFLNKGRIDKDKNNLDYWRNFINPGIIQ